MDSGFQSAEMLHENSLITHKARKDKPFTDQQKAENRTIGGIRISVEHAIGGMKRMKAASDIWRNRIGGMDDQVSLISAGLWNFYLEHTERTRINQQLQAT